MRNKIAILLSFLTFATSVLAATDFVGQGRAFLCGTNIVAANNTASQTTGCICAQVRSPFKAMIS